MSECDVLQDVAGKQNEKAERLRFGRFFYRFPNGESGADVYDRMTIFEDHMIRDINAGKFAGNTSLVLVTHGLALRVFLMRWFHWSVDQFLDVYNPPNAEVGFWKNNFYNTNCTQISLKMHNNLNLDSKLGQIS